MKLLIRIFIILFILIESNFIFAESLLPVNLELQFETDSDQPDWCINEEFESFPHISGDRGGIHISWDNFIRKFINDYLLTKRKLVKKISLDSSIQKDSENYIVTVKIVVAVENRESFEYFINNEYSVYHSSKYNKGHIFYASHQADFKPTIYRIPTLKKQPIDSSFLSQIPKNRKDSFVSVLNTAITSEDVKDPETQLVKNLPGLVVNWTLIKLLEDAKQSTEITEARSRLRMWMQAAIEFRINTLDGELLRLPDQRVSSLSRFLRLYKKGLSKDISFNEKRVALFTLYKKLMDNLQVKWDNRLSHIITNEDINKLISSIKLSIEKPANLRYFHIRELASLPVQKIARRITDKEIEKVHQAENIEKKTDHNYTVYRLADSPDNKALSEMSKEELLKHYAPDIIQAQQINQLKYNPSMDQIGQLKLVRNKKNDARVFVDVSKPTVYTHTRELNFGTKKYKQLSYEFWYPEHPKMFNGDKEVGLLDGRFLTITL